jgi:hypothetical protein
MRLTVIALILISTPLVQAKKERDWKIGKVADSKIVEIGSQTTQPRQVYGPFNIPHPEVTTTLTTTELYIVGPEYAYTVQDMKTRRCRYIVGDEIKYAQDKSILYLIDADGHECKAQVMKQERQNSESKQ